MLSDSDRSGSSSPYSSQAVVEALRQKAKKAEDLGLGIRPRLDDAFLARFLILRKGNVERAFDALKAYYKNVDLHRDFDGIQPLPYKNVFCSGVVGFLNERSKGRRILVFRAGNWDPSQISFLDIRICVFYHLQYASDDSDTQELGIIFIMDLAGISFAHIRDISFRDVRRSVNAMQNGLPIKLCQVHCLNPPVILRPLLTFTRSILKEKMGNRFHVHSSMETMPQHIEPEILPLSLGGQAEDANFFNNNLIQKIMEENSATEEFWMPQEDNFH